MASEPHDTPDQTSEPSVRPDRSDAENAVRTLIRWAGDDPTREGLLDTAARVVRSYEEFLPVISRTRCRPCRAPFPRWMAMTR